MTTPARLQVLYITYDGVIVEASRNSTLSGVENSARGFEGNARHRHRATRAAEQRAAAEIE